MYYWDEYMDTNAMNKFYELVESTFYKDWRLNVLHWVSMSMTVNYDILPTILVYIFGLKFALARHLWRTEILPSDLLPEFGARGSNLSES